MSDPAAAPPVVRTRLPWALYPKLVCVGTLLGSFVCVLVLILATPLEDRADWQSLVDQVGVLFAFLIVPGSFLTVLFSLLLFWPQRRTFLKQRWAQVKLVLLVVALPALHLLARSTFTGIRREVENPNGSPEGPTGMMEFFTVLVVVTIVVLLVALWLARFKPRLGQRPHS